MFESKMHGTIKQAQFAHDIRNSLYARPYEIKAGFVRRCERENIAIDQDTLLAFASLLTEANFWIKHCQHDTWNQLVDAVITWRTPDAINAHFRKLNTAKGQRLY